MTTSEGRSPARSRGGVALLFAGGLAIALGLPAIGLLAILSPGDGAGAGLGRQLVWLGIGVALLAWIGFAERRPLSSIGLKRPSGGTFGWGVAGAVALIASFMLCYALILPLLGLEIDRGRTGAIVANPVWLQLVIFSVAAFVEEIIYRGYLIERAEELSGSAWLALAVSIGAFILVHAPGWAASQLVVVAFGAVIMGLLYLWKRDLPMVMLAHFLANAVGFALAAAQR